MSRNDYSASPRAQPNNLMPIIQIQQHQVPQRVRSQDSFDLEAQFDFNNQTTPKVISYDKKRSRKPYTECIIRSSNPWRIRWDLLIIILALYNSISVPFTVAFDSEQEYILFDIWEYCVDCLFFLDIIVNFRLTYIDRNGDQIFQGKAIAKRYVLSGNFFIDLLATIPFELLPELFDMDVSSKTFQLFQVLKLIRLLRLRRIITYLKFKTDFKLSIRILLIIFNLFLFVHMAACFWHMIVVNNQDWIPPKDLGRQTDYYDSDARSSQYTTSLYYASLMLLGADILPYDQVQVTYACIILLSGSIVTAALFGHMTVLVQSLNKKTAKFHQQLDIANQAMTNITLPDAIQTKVLEYITYTYSNRDHQDEFKKFIAMISPSLKHEVYIHLYRDVLMRNTILASEEQAVQSMIYKLNTVLEQPEKVIFQRGDVANNVYFISRGEIMVTLLSKYGDQDNFKELSPGDYFGQIGLLTTARRTATVMTKNYCTIAEMNKGDLLEFIEKFPTVGKAMTSKLHKYEDDWHKFVIKYLQQVPYFSRCTLKELSLIAYSVKYQKYQRNTLLTKRGQDKVNYLIIVGTGEIQVVIESQKRPNITAAFLERGSACFVCSFLSDFKQIHTVRVSQPGIMLVITEQILESLYKQIPKLKKEVESFKVEIQKDNTKSDYFLGSNSRYREFNAEKNLMKFRIVALKILRWISIQRQKQIGKRMLNFLSLIDELIERQRENKEDENKDPHYDFKRMLKQILKNTNEIAEKFYSWSQRNHNDQFFEQIYKLNHNLAQTKSSRPLKKAFSNIYPIKSAARRGFHQ